MTAIAASASAQLHRRAVITLVFCTLLWSTAGIGTRQLERAEGFEITFWRSLFCVLFVLGHNWLTWSPADSATQHRASRWLAPLESIRRGGWLAFACGVMWCGMFVCFLVAMSLTSVANTLITMAIAPLLASLLAWMVLRQRIASMTWMAILAAGFGMFWMLREQLGANFGGQAGGTHSAGTQSLGMLIALGVPVCSALNLIIMKFGLPPRSATAVDFSSSLLTGALLSCVLMLPAAWPLQASVHDIFLLALLGIFQLGLPCLLMIRAARHLAAQETALLGLLEVIFGPLWVWLAVGERPGDATLQGGLIILLALAGNELFLKKSAPAG